MCINWRGMPFPHYFWRGNAVPPSWRRKGGTFVISWGSVFRLITCFQLSKVRQRITREIVMDIVSQHTGIDLKGRSQFSGTRFDVFRGGVGKSYSFTRNWHQWIGHTGFLISEMRQLAYICQTAYIISAAAENGQPVTLGPVRTSLVPSISPPK